RFSPYSYITLTRAMEIYDIRNKIANIRSEALFIGATSDILYSESEIKELASRILNAKYASLDAPFGHDSFLVAQEKLSRIIEPFLSHDVIARSSRSERRGNLKNKSVLTNSNF